MYVQTHTHAHAYRHLQGEKEKTIVKMAYLDKNPYIYML